MKNEEIFKNKWFTYNPETGEIFNHNNKLCSYTSSTGYITCRFTEDYKEYSCQAHRLAWYIVTGKIADTIDHINRIRNDNRFINLRDVNTQKNGFNRKANGYTFVKKTQKYKAAIGINYKQVYLGHYDTEEEASQAYLDAKKIYHII